MGVRRVWFGGVVVLLVGVVVFGGLLLGGGGAGGVLGGIPQAGRFLGDASAPVTLQYFLDVGCPPSRVVTVGPLARVIRGWVRPGLLRLEFRSVQEGNDPPEAFAAEQVAALAAGRQNKLWDYIEMYYQTQLEGRGGETDTCYVVPGFPRVIARRVPGLDFARWKKDTRSGVLAREVVEDQRVASAAGMRDNTPVYLIGRTGARQAAVKLPEFVGVDPALDGALHLLLNVKLEL